MNHFNNKSQRILVEKWQNEGNRAALDLLASSNQNIVRREAWKLSRGNTGIDVEDLIQEGMMGISIAANKYDSSKISNIYSLCDDLGQKVYEKVYSRE